MYVQLILKFFIIIVLRLAQSVNYKQMVCSLITKKVFLHTNPLTLVVSVNIFVVFLIFSFSLHVHFCLKRHLCLSLDATTAFLVADALKFWILRVK